MSAIKGKVVKATLIELAPEAKFVLVEIGDLAAGASPAVMPGNSQLVPFDPSGCSRVWTSLSSSDPELRALVEQLRGREVDGIAVPGDARKDSHGWCPILAGSEQILRGATPGADAGLRNFDARIKELASKHQDALLPGLGAARDFFGATDDLPSNGTRTPLDGVLETALAEMDTKASLTFALQRRMYFFADFVHRRWRKNPAYFDVIEPELIERSWERVGDDPPPGRVPGGSLTSLFWMTSPSRAVASLRDLYERQPDKVMTLLRSSPPRDEVFDLLLELTARDRARWLPFALSTLATRGNEHTLAFMKAEGGHVDAAWQRNHDERVALIEGRAASGVKDGHTLARYLWAHRDDGYGYDRRFHDMRVELTGASDGCCEIVAELGGGVKLDAEIDCDAESYTTMCKVPRGTTITAVGIIKSTFVAARPDMKYVKLEMGFAAVRSGGELPPTPDQKREPASPEPGGAKGVGCGCHLAARTSCTSLALWIAAAGLALCRYRCRAARATRRVRTPRLVC